MTAAWMFAVLLALGSVVVNAVFLAQTRDPYFIPLLIVSAGLFAVAVNRTAYHWYRR